MEEFGVKFADSESFESQGRERTSSSLDGSSLLRRRRSVQSVELENKEDQN